HKQGQAARGGSARHQPEDALQQAREVRYPGGQIGAHHLMTSPPEDARRPALPADLERLLHDLRGPLNSAVMHLEVVKRAGVSDPLAKQSLETIGQELQRLARMLPAAFSVAALDRNEMVGVGLRSVVEQEVRRLGTAGVSVVGSQWPRVRGDAEL